MHYPRVRRYIDDVCVREPAFYADHGGPGWYPELQHPIQVRLAVRYNPLLKKDVYIQPNSLFFSGLKDGLSKGDLRELLDEYGAERGMEFALFQPHKQNHRTSIGIMLFPSQRQAEDAMYALNKNSNHLGVSRGENRGDFRVRYSEINSLGHRQDDISDILLVREILSISDAYIPTYIPESKYGNVAQPSSPTGWHAVGYSRDQFTTKRKAQDLDKLPQDPRKSGKGKHAAEDTPSPPKRRALEPVNEKASDETAEWVGTESAIASMMRGPLQPVGLGHPSSSQLPSVPQHHSYTSTLDATRGPFRVTGSKDSKKKNKKSGRRPRSPPYYRRTSPDHPKLVSAPNGNRPTSRRMSASPYSIIPDCPELSVLSQDQKKVLSDALHLLGDRPKQVKGREVLDTPSQAEKFARDQQAARKQRRNPVASILNDSTSSDSVKEPKAMLTPAEIEQQARPTSSSPMPQSFISTGPANTGTTFAPLLKGDFDRKSKPGVNHSDPLEAGEIREHDDVPAKAISDQSLLDGAAAEALPARSSFTAHRETLSLSALTMFSHHLHPNPQVGSYREPRFIALSPEGKTLTLSHSTVNTRASRAQQQVEFPIESLSDVQRRILGVEKRWVLNGPAWEKWQESREGVVVLDARVEDRIEGGRTIV
ncbi:hypothetical protein L202_07320 [Cryptococcus amylolentus CBS 6039]|uniref:RRM domain-containing protein n=2 Tax=Cryptococcus amylolentus TaxID=104669 RepID=A0A1E3HBS7_9TREE|nr:hypothetical protein L202_07320 [Cryptococcus amylolentus CBS 6039]ODN73792.1 hypothetical protein L202_07320 [Cryptococcus amylolentus CBS 6039]ODO00340.1 hypothetical protein I350_06975 [Cryptococcus amylolentus CBS 6273]